MFQNQKRYSENQKCAKFVTEVQPIPFPNVTCLSNEISKSYIRSGLKDFPKLERKNCCHRRTLEEEIDDEIHQKDCSQHQFIGSHDSHCKP